VTDRPDWAPPEIDLTVPSVSRVYDYFLGGTHNFEVDQRAAQVALQALPDIPAIGFANRAVMARAVEFCVNRGVTQFLDIGSGIPTFNNVHEVAQDARPDARVVYVDHDVVAVAHTNAMLTCNPNATTALADLRKPRSILEHPETRRLLDFKQPIALLLIAVVHFLDDGERPAEIIAELRDALAPGSIMVITHASDAHYPSASSRRRVLSIYEQTGSPLIFRAGADIAPFFAGFDVVEPGIVPMPQWRPDAGAEGVQHDPAGLYGLAGVGVKR
jgi:SAM-dependent methyltransferase